MALSNVGLLALLAITIIAVVSIRGWARPSRDTTSPSDFEFNGTETPWISPENAGTPRPRVASFEDYIGHYRYHKSGPNTGAEKAKREKLYNVLALNLWTIILLAICVSGSLGNIYLIRMLLHTRDRQRIVNQRGGIRANAPLGNLRYLRWQERLREQRERMARQGWGQNRGVA